MDDPVVVLISKLNDLSLGEWRLVVLTCVMFGTVMLLFTSILITSVSNEVRKTLEQHISGEE